MLDDELGERGEEVGAGGAGIGLQAALREEPGIEDDADGGRRRGGEELGREGGGVYVVEREAGAVGGAGGGPVLDGPEVAGGDAGLEDQALVGLGDAAAVVYDGEGAVAARPQAGGDVDVPGAGVAGIAQELVEGVLYGAQAPGAPAQALDACEAGEASAKVPVGAFQGGTPSGPPRSPGSRGSR